MRVHISHSADTDLTQIISYLGERNLAAARSVADGIDRRFQNLARFPFIGRERSSLGKGIRSIVAGTYVIFYVVEPDQVTIVRILDGRRDIDAEFQR